MSIAWLSLTHPLNNSRTPAFRPRSRRTGSTARMRGSPKICPMDGGVSRGSSFLNTSNRGVDVERQRKIGRLNREALLPGVEVHDLPDRALRRLHHHGHVHRKRLAGLRLPEPAIHPAGGNNDNVSTATTTPKHPMTMNKHL